MGFFRKLFGRNRATNMVEAKNESIVKTSKEENKVANEMQRETEANTKNTSPLLEREEHDDTRLYYYDADGNECEKLIRDGELWTTITGIKYRKDPERIMSSLYEGATVILKPEPENPYDPYAVAIYFKNELIGYVPKKDVPAILTCISPEGTEGKINKIDPKFIGVAVAGTMEHIHKHACLSMFEIVAEKYNKSQNDSTEGKSRTLTTTPINNEEEEDENESKTEYVNRELIEELPPTQENLIVVRDNIKRRIQGDSPVFIGILEDDTPKYINPDSYDVLYIKNELMEESLRKGHQVGFIIEGLSDSDDLSTKIGIRMNVFFEKVFCDNKLKELNEQAESYEHAIEILSEGIEKANGGDVTYTGESRIEGDEEFNGEEMAEWEEYDIRIPFTSENEKQFMDIYPYLVTGKFLCFKGRKELGIGVYYCKKYNAYLKFSDTQLDAHIQKGNKVAFYIRDLNLADRTKDIGLKVALNLY